MADSNPVWPETAADHPLTTLNSQLDELLNEAEHDEIYGIPLASATPFYRNIVLQKFLRANANDPLAARKQLLSTLKWRKTFQALKTKDEVFSRSRFGGLGYIVTLTGVPESVNEKDIATFNIYGAVKDNALTFGDVEGFLRWRVGLMELGLARLDLSSATRPIPDYNDGPDPYQCIQVHDYLSVSFLRQNADAKAAAKKAIEIFQSYYPETLSQKLFVNVPIVMGWFYSAMTMVLSKETVKKFKVITYGKEVRTVLGPGVPAVYGGKGDSLDEMAETLKMND